MASSECNTTVKAAVSSDSPSREDSQHFTVLTLLVLMSLLDRRPHVVAHELCNQKSLITKFKPTVHLSPTVGPWTRVSTLQQEHLAHTCS